MGYDYDVGASGAWGVIIDEETVGAELMERINETFQRYYEDGNFNEGSACEQTTEVFRQEIEDALKMLPITSTPCQGPITLPEGWYLIYTGSDDERPGRTDTPAHSFVAGLGMYIEPWKWPVVHDSFKRAAALHTWVWGG